MSEILKAMGAAAAILFPVVILVIIITIAAVKRGEAAMRGGEHGRAHDSPAGAIHAVPTAATGAPAAPAPKKPAAAAREEISVIQVLLFGIIMFTVVMGLLLGVSILQHR